MNKIIKKIFQQNKLLTLNILYLTKQSIKNQIKKLLSSKKISFPVVVKPINEGSSLGVIISEILKI